MKNSINDLLRRVRLVSDAYALISGYVHQLIKRSSYGYFSAFACSVGEGTFFDAYKADVLFSKPEVSGIHNSSNRLYFEKDIDVDLVKNNHKDKGPHDVKYSPAVCYAIWLGLSLIGWLSLGQAVHFFSNWLF